MYTGEVVCCNRCARSSKDAQSTAASTSQSKKPQSVKPSVSPDSGQKLLPDPEASFRPKQRTSRDEALQVSAVCPICLQTKLDLGETGSPTYRLVAAVSIILKGLAELAIPHVVLFLQILSMQKVQENICSTARHPRPDINIRCCSRGLPGKQYCWN